MISDFQALITGQLIGALMAAAGTGMDITIDQHIDAEGNYLPHFDVIGNRSGNRVRVEVTATEIVVHP